MIAIIDYGVGNIRSVLFALQRLGVEARLAAEKSGLDGCDGVILPGVGAFSAAMDELRAKKLNEVLLEWVGNGQPLLGICVGFQLLFSESTEYGIHPGLGLVAGRVERFEPELKTPHMGWNQVGIRKQSLLFEGVTDNSYFYFAHSFFATPEDDTVGAGTTQYGREFVSCIDSGVVFGVQFHPEKSGSQGLRLLKNFCDYSRSRCINA